MRRKITDKKRPAAKPKRPTLSERRVIQAYLLAEETRLRAKIGELTPLLKLDCTQFLKGQIGYFKHAAAYLKFMRKRFDSSANRHTLMPLEK